MQESRAQRDISVSKQTPTPSRSVGPSISDAVAAHRFPTDWRLTVRRAPREKRKPDDGASIFNDGRQRPSITRYGFAATEGRSIEFGVSVLISSECVVPNGRATFLIDEVSTIGKKKQRRAL